MVERKRILITGASGFIGGFLVDEALRRGYEVWAGIRAGSSRKYLQDERIGIICLNYDSKDALVEQLRAFADSAGVWDYVIHNAGITKALEKKDFYKVNTFNTQILIEALAAAGCKPRKFLLMSSLSSYGPVNEDSFRPIRTDDDRKPNTAYGKSKLEAELFLEAQPHFPYIILLPTGVYGPEDRDYLMEIKSIKSGFDLKAGMKPQKITFIYVKDLVVAAFMAIENENVKNKSYFVADGDVYTDADFVRIVKKLLNKRFVISLRIPLWMCYIACFFSEIFGHLTGKAMTLNTDKYYILKQRNWTCDAEPIRRELGFTPVYDLRKGLDETIRYSKEKGLLRDK
ncbi:MAG: NAD(P)-dependent oxidoreductase [Tannerella sp.]|jgi:nucleoside-diphosphate-sugar epimerase|nr:NAD(P)-dependent oxidoreductase [Tannerella sp.]